ncbi:methyltransferase [Legionella longbeachae]|uniref:Putative methyltransferase n=1 Tax=Legionella longbeachae serogroup 1 (strain NSW150) TaxID=661367 RepID=D3HSU1_LEGLN|nr:methyltransferase [Legionella longbeachae]VEE02472.1 methyltransferase [Legionella oakridgensis]HBD7399447.1 methyltransferase domain-containing protein [Legionella pneumophila]ARB91254.1 methyltransferase domain-containing protein [Legionella longbeachae]ARM32320.1 methyltransferase domain-containing protein [Legionella longbeachae]EEZ94882.1 methyltransferase domain protein [Legionella longbeachae D-4968]
MTQLTKRSKEKELIDLGQDYYTPQEYIHSLKQLFKINKLMGIFKHTVHVLKQFSPNAVLVDVGCGGGLFLINLYKYYPGMHLLGLDVSKEAIQLAQDELNNWLPSDETHFIEFQIQQQPELDLSLNSVDIIVLNLVCHHLDDNELVQFLYKANKAVRHAIIINDLQRSFIAYWFYKIISPIFFKNRLITHDGLISIQKGFTRKELKTIVKQAKIHNYRIKWHFPFWWSILILK